MASVEVYFRIKMDFYPSPLRLSSSRNEVHSFKEVPNGE